MATPTQNLLLERLGLGENPGTWDADMRNLFDMVDSAIAGAAMITTTGGTTVLADAEYTNDQAKCAFIDVEGALVSDATIIVPQRDKIYAVRNATTGAFTLTIKTASGTGVTMPQGSSAFVRVQNLENDVDYITPPSGQTLDAVTALNAFAADNRLVRTDGTGKAIQDSGITVSDANAITGVTALTADTVTVNTTLLPDINDGAALGTTALGFADLHLAGGGTINWSNGTLTITQSGTGMDVVTTSSLPEIGTLYATNHGVNSVGFYDFTGRDNAANDQIYTRLVGYAEDTTNGSEDGSFRIQIPIAGTLTSKLLLNATSLNPFTNDGAALGTSTVGWSDLYLADGAVVSLGASSDVTLTHSTNTLTLVGGQLVLPAAGLTVGSSVPFSDSAGTLTLTNVDALDATTEATIESAIDTLANLGSIQGQAFTFGSYAPTILNNTTELGFKQAVNLEIGVDVQAYDADLTTWAGVTPAAGVTTFLATPSSVNLKAAVTDETGSGALVFANTPTLVTPVIGAATGTSLNLSSGTGLQVGSSIPFSDSAGVLTLQNVDALDATTEATIEAAIDTLANLGSIQGVSFTFGSYAPTILNNTSELGFKQAVNLEIGVDVQAFDTDLSTWAGVTPAAGVTAFLATPTSANLATAVTDETGSGALVFANTPTLVTPAIGAATGTSLVASSYLEALGGTTIGAIRAGNGADSTGTGNKTQIAFSFNSLEAPEYSHWITSRHNTVADNNALLFYTSDGTQNGVFPTNAIYGMMVENGKLQIGGTLNNAFTDTLDVQGTANIDTSLAMGGVVVLSDSAGTCTLQNVDALDATTEATIESAIDTLANLGSIQGQAFTFGAYAPTLLNNANEAAFKAATNLEIGVDVQAYDADLTTWAGVTPAAGVTTFLSTPTSANLNTAVTDNTGSGALVFGTSPTLTTSALLTSGFVFNWNSSDVTLTHSLNTLTLTGGSLVLDAAGLTVGASVPFSDSAGTLTLQNVDALDATTEATVEAAIDTLANLSSIQGQSFTFGSYAPTILNNTSEATFKAAVNLEIGVDVQAYDTDLATWAGVTPAAGVTTFLSTPTSANLNTAVTDNTGSGALMFATSPVITTDITIPNTGLHVLDTDASHDLIIAPGSNLTVDRTLTVTTGDANRTLDISAASVTVSSYGATLVDDADAVAARSTLGLVIGTNVQAQDAELQAIAGLTSAADALPYFTGSGTAAVTTLTSYARSILDDANEATFKATVNLEIGVDVQAYDADLTTWAGITPAAGVGTFLATPTSANLISAVTDETGSGALVFGTNPTLTTPTITVRDNALTITDQTDTTKALQFEVSGVTTATTRTLTVPNASGTLALTSDKLSAFAATTSAELLGVISDETGTGALVFANTPTLVTPAIGAATGTSLNLSSGTGLQVGASVPFSDAAGVLTLQNVDALDATTEATVEAAIDTLANLTSIQGRTVTLADAGANAIFGWDDAASAYENLTAAEATAVLNVMVGDSGAGGTKGLVPTPAAGDSTKALFGNGTWQTIPGGGDALTSGNLSQFAATTSLQFKGVISDETGSGAVVFADTPTLIAPILGTPTSGTLTNCTGLPVSTGISGLGTGVATFLATPSSANLIAAVTDETGSGSLVFANTPTLVTPVLGTPTSGTLTNCTGLPVSTGISGLGSNVATFLATPSSANLASALTDETGTGAAVFGTAPTFTDSLIITSTDVGASAAPDLVLWRNSASPADNDVLGQIKFDGEDSASNQQTYATISGAILDEASTSEDGSLVFGVTTAGSLANELVLDGASLWPVTTDGLALGTSSNMWSDLFLANGGVINFDNGKLTMTHSAGSTSNVIFDGSLGLTLYLRGAGNTGLEIGRIDGVASTPLIDFHSGATAVDYDARIIASGGTGSNGGGSIRLVAADFSPQANNGTALGTTSLGWADLHLASGGVVNWANGEVLLTASASYLALTGVTGFSCDGQIVSSVNGALAELRTDRSDNHGVGFIGAMYFDGKDNTNVFQRYNQIQAYVDDATAASEDSHLRFLTTSAGASTTSFYAYGGSIRPGTNDGSSLGISGIAWSDLFLASGGTLNFNNDVVLTHAADALAFTGAGASGYSFDNGISMGSAVGASVSDTTRHLSLYGSTYGLGVTSSTLNIISNNNVQFVLGGAAEALMTPTVFSPAANDGMALGSTSLQWSDVHLASGGVINWNNDITLTHSTDFLSFGGGTFHVDGAFKLNQQSGPEGGELIFRIPASGTTLSGDVYMDIYGDTLRIFEGNSPFSGVQFDLANTQPGGGSPTIYPEQTSTAIATTSGTSKDFTNIPSWATGINVILRGVSTNGTVSIIIQLGTGGTPTTSGYNSVCAKQDGTIANNTTGLLVVNDNLATNDYSGVVTLRKITGNTWVSSGTLRATTGGMRYFAGDIALGGTLDMIRLTTNTGINTFDAGDFNIAWW